MRWGDQGRRAHSRCSAPHGIAPQVAEDSFKRITAAYNTALRESKGGFPRSPSTSSHRSRAGAAHTSRATYNPRSSSAHRRCGAHVHAVPPPPFVPHATTRLCSPGERAMDIPPHTLTLTNGTALTTVRRTGMIIPGRGAGMWAAGPRTDDRPSKLATAEGQLPLVHNGSREQRPGRCCARRPS